MTYLVLLILLILGKGIQAVKAECRFADAFFVGFQVILVHRYRESLLADFEGLHGIDYGFQLFNDVLGVFDPVVGLDHRAHVPVGKKGHRAEDKKGTDKSYGQRFLIIRAHIGLDDESRIVGYMSHFNGLPMTIVRGRLKLRNPPAGQELRLFRPQGTETSPATCRFSSLDLLSPLNVGPANLGLYQA